MKRSILMLIFLIGSMSSGFAQGHVFMNFRTGFFNQNDFLQEEDYFRKEVRELNQFRKKVDRFIISANKEEWVKADFIKSSLVRDMKDEIHQTEKKIRFLKSSQYGNQDKGEIYSKRDTERLSRNYNRYYGKSRADNYGYRKQLLILEHRLETQKMAMHDVLRTRIGYGTAAWRNVKYIERAMLRFEDTLREEIREIKSDFRNDGLREHPRSRR